ncbi:hypothetical protein [Candidatus Bartonella washoeensis]|uniref:Uncharacterized protein n=1 Tax=Cardidatus Bartonella washoeensis 085-0475 TaxID=1094564 RepID=J1JPX8_9HYPH|nr:hypothetical protein [Bartonella washoeensis]EJF86857.1 hypothetical protein MCW_00080 [Bartonella washoeensis 085-0475]
MFFSYFNLTYTSSISGLSVKTRYALEVPEQHPQKSLINNPTTKANKREKIASGAMREKISHFSKELQEGLEKITNNTNKQFQAINR